MVDSRSIVVWVMFFPIYGWSRSSDVLCREVRGALDESAGVPAGPVVLAGRCCSAVSDGVEPRDGCAVGANHLTVPVDAGTAGGVDESRPQNRAVVRSPGGQRSHHRVGPYPDAEVGAEGLPDRRGSPGEIAVDAF